MSKIIIATNLVPNDPIAHSVHLLGLSEKIRNGK